MSNQINFGGGVRNPQQNPAPSNSLDAQREDNPDKLWAMIRERDIQIAKYKRSFEVVELLVRLLKENIDDARN